MRLEYFQMVDGIVSLDLAGHTIRATAQVPAQSPIFEGHFPGHPLMPGVLLIETMAQTAGWLIIAATKFEKMPFLVGVKEAKLRAFVTPGQALAVSAQLKHQGSGFAVATAQIEAAGKTACNAEMTFFAGDFPTADFRAQMIARAREIGFPDLPAAS